MAPAWGGRRAQQAREWCIKHRGRVCALCGHYIDDLSDYTVGHILDRKTHPHLTWVKTNWQPEHGKRHPELGCVGNFGKSNLRPSRGVWIAPGF